MIPLSAQSVTKAEQVVQDYVGHCNEIGSRSRIYSTYLAEIIATALDAQREADIVAVARLTIEKGERPTMDEIAAAIRQQGER